MKIYNRHTPSGLDDLLPVDYACKQEIERRIETVFSSYGYGFISSPVLEYRAVFKDTGSVPQSRMYSFIDKNGDILALRSDMTPPAARIAATHPTLGFEKGPLRLCYSDKVFRNHEHLQGKANEFSQTGVELMGVCSVAADAEVIAIALKSLRAAGLTDFRVDIGQVDFLKGLSADSGLNAEEQNRLTQHLIEHDYVAAESLLASVGKQYDLTQWMGGVDTLKRAKETVSHAQSLAAIRHLEEIYHYLQDQGLANHVLFDLTMTGYLDYYTGLIFRGYAKGTGDIVLDGGRYDNLLAVFGKPSPAVGFAIRLDSLLCALSQPRSPAWGADTLLLYRDEARETALRTADELRNQQVRIENSLLGDDLSANIAYAKQKGMGGIVYFVDKETVRLIDLGTGEDVTVSVDSLLSKSGEEGRHADSGIA